MRRARGAVDHHEIETRRITLGSGPHRREVVTRVVEERETADGELVEISRNFFALCAPPATSTISAKRSTSTKTARSSPTTAHGSRAGTVRCPASSCRTPRSCSAAATSRNTRPALRWIERNTWHQPRGNCPAGTFKGCIETRETSPLEPGAESTKFYCPGVGLVIDNELELAAIYFVRRRRRRGRLSSRWAGRPCAPGPAATTR